MGKKKNHLLRIPADRDLIELVDRGIKALNEGGYMEITVPSFARQALRYYSQLCITKQIGLAFKPKDTKKDNGLDD